MDYKKYSLENLQNWVHDAMSSDASPHEIYSVIREAVREDYYYHKDCISRATGLLELLSGHRPMKNEDKILKWQLPVEEDSNTGEYFVSFPDDLLEAADLKEGDQVYWVDNGDGTWIIRKVTKPLGMDEC
jgi:hypothetical protein